MKAKELMIGDWVKERHNGLHRFTQVDGEILLIMIHEHSLIEPIPLTPEILEKNGFYDRNTQWHYKRFWSNGCFDIAVALDYREIEISKVCGSGTDCEEVEYGSTIAFGSDINVHELQHALRLCGLNELADGFKV